MKMDIYYELTAAMRHLGLIGYTLEISLDHAVEQYIGMSIDKGIGPHE